MVEVCWVFVFFLRFIRWGNREEDFLVLNIRELVRSFDIVFLLYSVVEEVNLLWEK